jgi:hypothetical protein
LTFRSIFRRTCACPHIGDTDNIKTAAKAEVNNMKGFGHFVSFMDKLRS